MSDKQLTRMCRVGADATEEAATGEALIEPVGPDVWSGLSFGQRRLLFLDELSPGGAEYLVSVCLRVRGSVDWGAVRCGCLSVVGRHEVFAVEVWVRGRGRAGFFGAWRGGVGFV